MTRRDTPKLLLDAGADLLREGGYEYAGTSAILERAGVPRGSFYHYFKSKDDFVRAAAERWSEEGSKALGPILTNPARPPLARLRDYFAAAIAMYTAEEYRRGCLLGTLGQELGGRGDDAADVIVALFDHWRDALAACLYEARERGDLAPGVAPEVLAAVLIDAWEGALIQMKLRRSAEPLRLFLDVALPKLLA